MPELPEVENVVQSLTRLGVVGQIFSRVDLLRKDLRTALRPTLKSKLPGQKLHRIIRRAKYLIFETEDFALVSHLGMTGSWRREAGEFEPLKHDHVVLRFADGWSLVFNDPRRFGVLELSPLRQLEAGRWFRHLGVEPLLEGFTADYLFARTRRRSGPIKNFIMDQKQVVGVGNIYASEALYRARVRPTRPAGRITRAEAARIVESIRQILADAIVAGGSTIRDYRNSEGTAGQFQERFAVYDRDAEPCRQCGKAIRSAVLAGRNTFWCSNCQR